MLKEIYTEKSPAAVGPYSQAIEAGDFVFLSGAIPLNPETGEVVDGIKNQTMQVMENLKSVLTEAKTDFSKVVKFTIYLDSMDDFPLVNEIYGNYLEKPYPARATVEVSRLPKNVSIEIDAIAFKG